MNSNLGTEKISKLLMTFAIPSVIANLVSALYNIVDQIFIGQGVGTVGNAATNIAFPITTICLSLGLLIGIGCASNFNIEMGRKNVEGAKEFAGTAFSSLIIIGVLLLIIIRTFLEPLMYLFGADSAILPYAMDYSGITSFGIPFLLLTIGGNPIIRADGSAKYSMLIMVSGAILNTILDPIFIFVFDFGIKGAAWATVISQIVSAIILLLYIRKFKSFTFVKTDFIPKVNRLIDIARLGVNSFIYQISTTAVQICSANLLRYYGAMSIYGSTIPIAASGVTAKINMIFVSIVLGIVQGSQPIIGYNFGAKKYDRVRETFFLLVKVIFTIGVVCFFIFELFAPQLINIFGKGNELYTEFSVRYLRTFLFFVSINGVQIAIGTFFPSIGNAKKGVILSLSKQIVFLIPLMFLLSSIIGVYGVVIAVPIADLASFLLAVYLMRKELKTMPKEDLSISK